MSITKKALAEFMGTFWLVFAGVGSAVLAAKFILPGSTGINLGIGFVGVSLAFGLSVMTMAYAIGHISGCHLNPAVSIGLCVAKRFPSSDLVPYILSQLLGGIAGAGVLYLIARGQAGFTLENGFGCNGYQAHSPGGYGMSSALVAETALTFMFLMIILGATDKRAPHGFAPIAIGLGLTLIHLVGIPVTNLSVNPARSTATALIELFHDGWAVQQLWLFWVAPILGAVLAGLVYTYISRGEVDELAVVRAESRDTPVAV